MPIDWSSLDFLYQNDDDSSDSSEVLPDYIEYIANKRLRHYKYIIQYGGKEGESVWTHIMNLITMIEKLRLLFHLSADEMRCLLLALTVHDLNKVDVYGKANGRNVSYANAASKEHIEQELDQLDASSFFPQWRDYLFDIVYLAHAHQEGSTVETVFNEWEMEQCHLDRDRLEGALKYLMKAADVSDNSHSGNYALRHERHIRDKLRDHINSALNMDAYPRRYRFVGHHIAELRGLMTNVMHNELVAYMRETYGKEACIDLLYHPEGVDYLLDKKIPFTWTPDQQKVVAVRIGQRFAKLQLAQLAQFIKATPSGIGVDAAAMQSGATIEVIFNGMANVVGRKQYRLEWREERNRLVRSDLVEALASEKVSTEVKERINALLQEVDLVPANEEALKRGEFVMAYRNFLKDHRSDRLKMVKQDAWSRVARLFQLPETADAVNNLIDPYRRGYFMARDLPVRDVEEMVVDALEDMQQLEVQAAQAQAGRKTKKPQAEETSEVSDETAETSVMAFDSAYIVDYLERHLEVWDSLDGSAETSAHTRPVQTIDFAETLRRYADAKQPHKQCCYCGSALKAEEWMSIQVPPSIGVQSFSNRLEAGSSRDPKRNVCDVCRTQFILEKLAWRSHRDKQGSEQVTFYLHLFPYTYFTQPMLLAWWQSIKNLQDTDHKSLLLDTQSYFSKWGSDLQADVSPRCYRSSIEGLGIPTLSEALSNTPVLPLMISGGNYGLQFLIALEKTALLAQWFDSRVILSRMPVPSLNLANERIGEEPVALLVENPPQSMSWLLPQSALTRKNVDTLCRKLCNVHQLADKLVPKDEKFEDNIYDLVVAAASDPLALYYEVDRLIEQQAGQKKGRKPEYQAMSLSHVVAPMLKELTTL